MGLCKGKRGSRKSVSRCGLNEWLRKMAVKEATLNDPIDPSTELVHHIMVGRFPRAEF